MTAIAAKRSFRAAVSKTAVFVDSMSGNNELTASLMTVR
jgi:hypothetical protein